MNSKLALLVVVASLSLATFEVRSESLVTGSADAGKARALTCTACHGPDGNSATPLWPNLAGQNAPYLLAQLQAFKSGKRQDPLMSSQALLLSDDDMANLAVYFESLPAGAQAIADANLLDRGAALYRGGDKKDEASACLACHGPSGRGNPAAKYPALRGQHASYTTKQLNDFASGLRTTDGVSHMMRDIAATLDKTDIAALSSYIQGLK